MKTLSFIFLCFFAFYFNVSATVWIVGPTRTHTLPSQIKELVADGDIIQIDGGVYLNDYTKWNKKNLTFLGLGTLANPTILRSNADIPNGKGIFVFELPGISDNPTIENIVFDGAQVSNDNGGNGAGIRFQSVNLTVKNCKFLNCQNGILEGNGGVTNSVVTITNTEFYNNGYQLPDDPEFSGYEHHIYIGASTLQLTIQNCYFHRPRGQANSIKTRAQSSYILYNYIDEETDGYGSWEINIAQGGQNIILGNVIIQGESGSNHGIVGYDEAINVLEDFYFVNNTVVNKWQGAARYFNIIPATEINTFKLINNIFASNSSSNPDLFGGNIPSVLVESANVFASNYSTFGFVAPNLGNYKLTNSVITAIDQGINAGNTNQLFSLTPNKFYSSFLGDLNNRVISGNSIDIGAFEFNNIALPIKIIEFGGLQKTNSIELTWQIAEGTKIDYIEIERSNDSKNFKKIVELSQAISYVDTDLEDNNFYYYRMKIKDLKGKMTVSKIIGIEFNQKSIITIGPNPAKNDISFLGQILEIDVDIANVFGQIIQKKQRIYPNQQLNIEMLPIGIYLIICKNPKTELVFKVLKMNKI